MKEPMIIQIPCYDENQPVDSRSYDVNYPSEASFKRRGIPEFWRERTVYSTIKTKDIKCRELEFYQGKNHVASVLVNLEAKRPINRLIEVQLHRGDEWLAWARPINAVGLGSSDYYAYFNGGYASIYWNSTALKNDQGSIKEERQPLIKNIYEFVCQFIYQDQLPEFNSSLEKEDVEAMLNDYIALNPSIRAPLSPGLEISIPENTWKFHAEQLKTLTKYGCISDSYNGDFRHPQFDLALKIVANPLLSHFYEVLGGESDNLAVKLNETCIRVTEGKSITNLTGMDFTALFSESTSKAITLEPGTFSQTESIFDHARFDELTLGAAEDADHPLNWEKVSLRHASFQGAQLSRMNFTHANLEYAVFNDANLNLVDFTNAKIADADFSKAASLEKVTWPLIKTIFRPPKLNWNRDGADFIIQQLDLIGRSEMPIEQKQAWAKALLDRVLSNITVSEELIKFSVLIDEKETRFAYLREETTFFRGAFFGRHGNTDTWHDLIGILKSHLDLLVMKETPSGLNENYQKVWEQESQLDAFKKIMCEHRGRGWGEVTHTKLYSSLYSEDNQKWSTVFNNTKDTKKLRDAYINQDKGFKEIIDTMHSRLN